MRDQIYYRKLDKKLFNDIRKYIKKNKLEFSRWVRELMAREIYGDIK